MDQKEEILNACYKLYEKESFKDITIKKIGEKITLSRPSIYNYFETKEEIFLLMFQKEYEKWNVEIDKIIAQNDVLTKEELANLLAHTLENRKILLKLLAMNLYDMEENSRLACLVDFKKAYKRVVDSLKKCLTKFCQDKTEADINEFVSIFFPFMYGIYPYGELTSKQKEAMNEAKVEYVNLSFYDIAYMGIKKLLI